MAEQLFQIGIKGLIRDEQGKILLLKTPAWKDIPSYWDLPGGRMDPGETFVQTLRRELKEEIGVDYAGEPKQIATVLSNLQVPVSDDLKVPLVLMAYEVDLPHNTPITLEDHEEAYDWFDPQDAARELRVKFPDEFCDVVGVL